jgi:polar amino acid transport system ATP-binding protein
MNSAAHFLTISNLTKSFADHKVLQDISLDVEAGELIALIGPSGCGKSTLLRCLNGLEVLDSGKVEMSGARLQSPNQTGHNDFHSQCQAIRKNVGMVFQSFNLFPHLTVLENLLLAPTLHSSEAPAKIKTRAEDLLKKVGLTDKTNAYPNKLSGGQQQRAAIARALTLNPKLMLYDEPTSALDPGLVNEVLKVMKQLDEDGMTQIVVTHEMRFAREVADKIVFLEHGQIIEMGPPKELFSQPRTPQLREFLKDFL